MHMMSFLANLKGGTTANFSKDRRIEDLELHCFSDASGTAYGAVLYARCNGTNHLLCSKNIVVPNSSKTATTKATIPKLELHAAAMVAQLLTAVQQELRAPTTIAQLWTDSQCVVNLPNSQERQKRYIENQLARIRQFPVNQI
uniref:RNase H type-1 domain-containing protein n=1 Tax=Ditylenchus dipsaci TaxID=166011 RepID=A0A915D286_9BILA